MGSAHSEVEHRMLVSRTMRIVCRPSKLALHSDSTPLQVSAGWTATSMTGKRDHHTHVLRAVRLTKSVFVGIVAYSGCS